jgi:serine/threonine protein phosphatase PrpC
MFLTHINTIFNDPLDETPNITVTTGILQLCKGEDVKPTYQRNTRHVACLVADGHSGKGCTTILDTASEQILENILNNGVQTAMDTCLELCKGEDAGAMVVLTRFDIVKRTLEICSIGDASCTVYQNNRLIHAQPHHSCTTVTNNPQLLAEMNTKGFGIESAERLTMVPGINSRSMTIQEVPSYFRWSTSPLLLAAASFVGHYQIPRLSPCFTTIPIPPGSFHMVMSSDGVSDMVHPEDELLTRFGVTANDIIRTAEQRWTTPYFNTPKGFESYANPNGLFVFNTAPTTQSQYAVLDGNPTRIIEATPTVDNNVNVTFFNGKVQVVSEESITIEKHNSGADDISVLVMSIA